MARSHSHNPHRLPVVMVVEAVALPVNAAVDPEDVVVACAASAVDQTAADPG